MNMHLSVPTGTAGNQQYVTMRVGGQLFGLPIEAVHEVFGAEVVTRVPLAPLTISGVLNLRGRIVTMVNLRSLLGLPPATATGLAVGIGHEGEMFGLMIDDVGDVLGLDVARREANPPHLDPRWAAVVGGVHRLPGELMLVLNVDLVLRRAGGASGTIAVSA